MLDPTTIVDVPFDEDVPDVYIDTGQIEAPLPAVTVGAVIEYQVVVKDKEPFFDKGVSDRFFFGMIDGPVQNARLVLEVPTEVSLRYAIKLFPEMKVKREEKDGEVRITFAADGIKKREQIDLFLPPETYPVPCVIFSTAAAWKEIAERYHGLVEEQIGNADLKELVKSLIKSAKDKQTRIEAIADWMRHNIRYTGVEFGENAIIPYKPAEVIKRKYGDCKDQAALMVAMLRHAEIPAYVALSSAGGPDPDPDLPGMGVLDHAIVYVPGEAWYMARSYRSIQSSR